MLYSPGEKTINPQVVGHHRIHKVDTLDLNKNITFFSLTYSTTDNNTNEQKLIIMSK